MKRKIRTCGSWYKKMMQFVVRVPKDDVECEHFTVIFINSLLVYENKHYFQVYLGSCAY